MIKKITIARAVRWACIMTLVSLGLMVWSLLQPTPLPVIVAMSVGQGLGTLSLVLYLFAISMDLRGRKVLDPRTEPPPVPPPPVR